MQETPTQELEQLDISQQLVKFDAFGQQLAELETKFKGVVYNLDDETQNKQARADRLKLGKVISSLDAAHKAAKEPLAFHVKRIDGRRKEIKDQLLVLQEGIKDQINAHDAKLQAHQDALDAKVSAIRAMGEFDPINPPDSKQIGAQVSALFALEIDETYEDRAAEAMVAKKEVIASLEQMLGAVAKREAEQAELRRLQQEQEARELREREDKIAKDAAEKATRDAEAKADADRIAAEMKVAAELKAQKDASDKRIAEIEKKQRDAEADQLRRKCNGMIEHINGCAIGLIGGEPQPTSIILRELEEKIVIDESYGASRAELEQARKTALQKVKVAASNIAAKRETERLAFEARQADEAHRATVEREAVDDLRAVIDLIGMMELEIETPILEAIKEGAVRHVNINY